MMLIKKEAEKIIKKILPFKGDMADMSLNFY